jgi:hypothetical protein
MTKRDIYVNSIFFSINGESLTENVGAMTKNEMLKKILVLWDRMGFLKKFVFHGMGWEI